MFSDRFRLWKMAAALAVVLGLGAYYAYVAANLEAGWRWCLEDPVGRDGATLVFPLWTVTRIDGPDRYAISKIIKDIPVRGDTGPLKVGTTVSIVGTFDAADTVVVEEVREIHTLRPYKEALGVLGVVLVVIAAPFFFRVRGGRVVERKWRT
jgi:hypothetical protein